MELKNTVAIVTGSGKGIGLATANALLDKGARVVGWSRSGTRLDHPNFHSMTVDMRNESSVMEAYHQTIARVGTVSILINNAGLGYEGNLDDLTSDRWHEMFDVNVHGIFYATKLVLPEMKKQQCGHIINISSVAGTIGIPGMAAYCATKYAVRGFSNALYKEVRNFGVKVTCVYPGSVKTNFFDSIDSVQLSDNMMMPEDIAATLIHCLESPDNYLPVDIEVRPMRLRA